MSYHTRKGSYGIFIAIIIAGALIAVAVLLSGSASGSGNQGHASEQAGSASFRVPDETDHIRGNQDAPITVVEYSDFECPFCARLHPTLARLIEENDDVRWVYRHLPLSTIHSRALGAAVASECIAELGTNDNFWTFADAAFAGRNKLNDAWYKETAASFGIEEAAFESCLSDRSVVSQIREDSDEAAGLGGRGTPFVVVLTASGQRVPFSGALSYEQVSNIIEQARNN